MNDCMTFPDTVEEFMEQYKVVDTEHIYTNGSEFVPIFRMKQWLEHLPPAQQNARMFQGVIVEYPTNSTYPEHEGKPYFLIKYTEDGQDFIGYGTYKLDVLSEYLKKYFMPSVQPETAKRIVGKSRNGMTLWYQCDTCNEPVDAQDNYCRGCGRRLIDE